MKLETLAAFFLGALPHRDSISSCFFVESERGELAAAEAIKQADELSAAVRKLSARLSGAKGSNDVGH